MKPKTLVQLVSFLRQELALPEDQIALAQRYSQDKNSLAMVLWQYGMLTIEQLEKVFDWIEAA